MAAVQSTRQRAMNRAAVALVVLITLVYLVPIYWITSTAFKPRSLATTVPPTVVFTPEVTAFADTLEAVCVEAVESGQMTKDLALLISKDQAWLTTEDFLGALDERLQAKMGS